MKRKVWTISPLLYVAIGLMAVMAGVSWLWNPIVFWIESIGTAVLILIVIISAIRFKLYIRSAINGIERVVSGDELENLKGFRLPILVVGAKGDIVWGNDAFDQIVEKADYQGTHISSVLGNDIFLNDTIVDGVDITIGQREFTVMGRYTDAGSMLYFVEDTHYKAIERDYEDTRPVVILVDFDNREEISRNAEGGEESRILGQVESTLNDWAYNVGGLFKKLSGGARYLVLTDEANFNREKEHQFPILDQIREIKTSGGRSATISMGVGKSVSNFSQAEKWARQSLEMALGRGGDQVAVKQESDSYEFYGGLSKGVEKRDKSRTRVIAGAISDQISISDLVLVMGHKYSDLDSVGSAVGMWSAARKGMGKPAYVVIDKEQTLAQSLVESVEDNIKDEDYPIFITPEQAMEVITPRTLLVVTDTHSQDYVESAELLDSVDRIIVIDHHRLLARHIKNAAIFYHEPYASSASEMVAELAQFIGTNSLTKVESEALLSGIMLDTKNFVVKCGVRTFEAAAYLRRRGADTVDVKRMFSGSIENYKAKFQLVSAAEIYGNCAIACAPGKSVPNIRIVAAQAADELLSIQGVVASFVVFESAGEIGVSARSLGDVNVQILMEELGGGGHLTMAGAQMRGINLEQARMTLLKVLQTSLPKATKFQS